MSYNIAPIPTLYRGRKYRSRLEARWAAFFDLVGWRHEYEPYDLGGWSPDFLLHTDYGDVVLVEVKPHVDLQPEVAAKIEAACTKLGRDDTVLVLNVAPVPLKADVVAIGNVGLIGDHGGNDDGQVWHQACIGWSSTHDKPGHRVDLVTHSTRHVTGYMSADCGHEFMYGLRGYREHTMSLWAEASNIVQWQARRS